jgi:hypothetical protein
MERAGEGASAITHDSSGGALTTGRQDPAITDDSDIRSHPLRSWQMEPQRLREVLTELEQCRALVRIVKRHIDWPADRETLYEVDARLDKVIKNLQDEVEACKSNVSQPATDK